MKAKRRSSSWWIKYFLQTKLKENGSATKKFEQAAAKNSYEPACQVFHLKSHHWKSTGICGSIETVPRRSWKVQIYGRIITRMSFYVVIAFIWWYKLVEIFVRKMEQVKSALHSIACLLYYCLDNCKRKLVMILLHYVCTHIAKYKDRRMKERNAIYLLHLFSVFPSFHCW